MNNIILISITSLIFLVLIVIVFLLLTRKNNNDETKLNFVSEELIKQSEKFSQLAQQNRELREALDKKLSETYQANQAQFGQNTKIIQNITSQSAKLISEVTEKLTKLDETNKQVVNFSAQLQNLQDILKNPKQRGVLGEYFLEETLKNVLPPGSYKMQYPFKDGTIVDAVVFVKDKIIPVDAKFSLETYEKILATNNPEQRVKLEQQFRKDLKGRIDETSKYVKPNEKTMEFAFMFIPSEAIYYDLLVNKVGAVKINTRDLIEYAFRDKKVVIVSPTSFLAYLQTVLQGLKAMQIEEKAQEIRANIEKLQRHMNSYDEFMKKLGLSMSTTVNHYNNAYGEFKKVDKDITKITGQKSDIKVLKVEGPQKS